MPLCKTPRADYVDTPEARLVPGTEVEVEDEYGQGTSMARMERNMQMFRPRYIALMVAITLLFSFLVTR